VNFANEYSVDLLFVSSLEAATFLTLDQLKAVDMLVATPDRRARRALTLQQSMHAAVQLNN
jgi:hypothetical protein